MKTLSTISFVLVIIGGLNWLLVGIFGAQGDVVSYLGDVVARIVYVLVGLSALYQIFAPKSPASTM